MSNLSFSDQIDAYKFAYNSLNPAQKEAVDEIYGPVMVVAGPGTGKTQLLAVRVCRILELTDATPENIVCLTYTDAGTTAMRKRLVKFLGSAAYQVNIFTFHSFCNSIIRENAEYFNTYRELVNASELEIQEILTEIMDELPLDHPLKRLAGNIYYDRRKWQHLFNSLKREGWSPAFVKERIESHIEDLKNDEKNISSQGATKGQLKATVLKDIAKLDFPYHGSELVEVYNAKLVERGLIDFDDSINWVLKALKANTDLLLKYQEKLQFILADEYQDTNGTQNDLLFTLAQNEFVDQPNIFVVGDDDQSIYRFQGASMDNITRFIASFSPKIIVLENNYRSAQSILDAAGQLINYNNERLISSIPDLTKELTESRASISGEDFGVQVIKYNNGVHQNCGVALKINALHEKGVPYNEMAIIYRKHSEAEDLVKYFTFMDIPLSVKKRVDILTLPEIERVLLLLAYLQGEYKEINSQNDKLFRILHFNFWGLQAKDIGKLAFYASRNNDYQNEIIWRDFFSTVENLENLEVENLEDIKKAMLTIESLINDFQNVTPQVFFEKVITETGLLNHILKSPDQIMRLQAINTIFDFIKAETNKKEGLRLEDILITLGKMQEMDIALPINVLQTNEGGINLMTAHGSKGLEFEHVFILNATEDAWVEPRASNNNVTFPPNIFFTAGESSVEDDRRLFYVAVTRAKNNAYISYPNMNESGQKELIPTRFINELGIKEQADSHNVDEGEIARFTAIVLKYHQSALTMIDHELIDRVLETMHMNATAISKFLTCPLTYYFENILRVPKARNANLGFGNAVHFAFEVYFKKLLVQNEVKVLPSEELLFAFSKGMKKFHSHFTSEEFKNLSYYGSLLLTTFYNRKMANWVLPEEVKVEYKIKTHIGDIPVSGILDRVDFYKDHIQLFDYKTGSRDHTKNEKFKKGTDLTDGGDYWRQGVFYKLLLQTEGKNTLPLRKITFEMLEREVKSTIEVEATQEEINLVAGQLEYVYGKIKNHDFSDGCNKPECEWCNFVNKNMPLLSSIELNDEQVADQDDY